MNGPVPVLLLERLRRLFEKRARGRRSARFTIEFYASTGHEERLMAAAAGPSRKADDALQERIAEGVIDVRIAAETQSSVEEIAKKDWRPGAYHMVALFDEVSVSIRQRRTSEFLPSSPFCVRKDIAVENFVASVKLEPNPGDAPFSSFVRLIGLHERQEPGHMMAASADTRLLNSAIDAILGGPRPVARWLFLADRALPNSAGMKSTLLSESDEGRRATRLFARDYGSLTEQAIDAFDNKNLELSRRDVEIVLRDAVAALGAAPLEALHKSAGRVDHNLITGFVGMLLAARDIRRNRGDALIAPVDGRMARLWLRLGDRRSGERCDLLSLRREEDRFHLTAIEVKTIRNADTDVEPVLEKARSQVTAVCEALAGC